MNEIAWVIGLLVIFVLVTLLVAIIYGIYMITKTPNQSPVKPQTMVPSIPPNFHVTPNYDMVSNQYQWILAWTPSTGTPPITYYYNLTTQDNQPFLNGSTTDNKLVLTGAKNNTVYNVSLYAKNAFGQSTTSTLKIKTSGPPIINKNTISVGYDNKTKYIDIYGDTNIQPINAESNLQIADETYHNNDCNTKNLNTNNPGFTCLFTPDNVTPGDELSFDVTVENRFGSTSFDSPFIYKVPGISPSPPSNIRLNL